jgi:hypothetical protein
MIQENDSSGSSPLPGLSTLWRDSIPIGLYTSSLLTGNNMFKNANTQKREEIITAIIDANTTCIEIDQTMGELALEF